MSIKTDCYKEGEKVGKGQVKFELRCKKKKDKLHSEKKEAAAVDSSVNTFHHEV